MKLGKVRSPFENDKVARVGQLGDGDEQFSNLLVQTSLLVNRKPLGQMRVAGDDSTGRLAVPNPRYTGTSTNIAMDPRAYHNEVAWGNHYRWFQKQTQGYDTNVRFTQQYRVNTPIALPNIIPTRIH